MKRILRKIAVALAALLVLLAGGGWLALHGKELTARHTIPDVERYAQEVDALRVPETAELVGLGEATHGNAEFQALRLTVLKRLVMQGYRAFAMEIDFGEGLMVDAYIQGVESGDASEIVGRLGYPIARTAQTVELIEWMRAYNASASPEDRLRFYGFDMQNTMEGARRLIDFCEAERIPGMDEELSLIARLTESDAQLDAVAAGVIEDALRRVGEAMEGYGTEETRAAMRQAARTLAQAMGTYTLAGGSYADYRDRCMADNVDWIVRRERQLGGGKVMLAAHNAHIARQGEGKPLGSLLDERYGARYWAIGTDFFTADVNVSTSTMIAETPKRGIHRFCSADPLAYQARRMPGGMYALTVSDVGEESAALHERLHRPTSMGGVGEGYMPLWYLFPDSSYRAERVPAALYDQMVFVYHAHPTEMLE